MKQADVRSGSGGDICAAKPHVCFAPNSDRESGPPEKVMSALLPEADLCGANRHVSFGPIADTRTSLVCRLLDHLIGPRKHGRWHG